MSKHNTLLIGACLGLGLCYFPLSAGASVVKEGDITVRVVRTGPDRYEAQMSGPTVSSRGAITSILLDPREHTQGDHLHIEPITESDHFGKARRFSLMVQPHNMGQCEGSELVGKGDLASIRLPLALFAGIQQERGRQNYNCGTTQEQAIGWGQELGMVVGVGNRLAAAAQLEGAKFSELNRYYGQRVLLGKVTIDMLHSGSREINTPHNLRAESNIYLDFSGLNVELDDFLNVTAKTPFIYGMLLNPGKVAHQTFGINITQNNRVSDNIARNRVKANDFFVRFQSKNGGSKFLLKSEDGNYSLAYRVEKEGVIWNDSSTSHQFPLESIDISNWDFMIKTDIVDTTLASDTMLSDTLTVIMSPTG
ncbi:hypothetical protein [Aeromonas finlandensis]|uniref:hypothetical protein n=1 Tax=Aeromonas finlandensis TaxID=1543375 RepID=UPI000A40FEFB|nr:hypothetical protein [Aeromonas finlandensis]